MVEKKCGGAQHYRNLKSSLPVISEVMAELLVLGEDGRFFHHDKEYYDVVLRKAFPDKEFKFPYIRHHVLDVRRMQEII